MQTAMPRRTLASQGQKIVTMAMTDGPWDTLIPFNTTNANTDAVLELILTS